MQICDPCISHDHHVLPKGAYMHFSLTILVFWLILLFFFCICSCLISLLVLWFFFFFSLLENSQ
jgi:hypothetical protein